MKVLGNVCHSWMMGMVIWMTVVWRRRNSNGKRHNGTFGWENQGIFDHRTCPCIVIRVLNRFNRGMFGESRHSCVSSLVIFDHIDSLFKGLVVGDGWERRRMLEADKNTDVKELILWHTEFSDKSAFGSKGEIWARGNQIKRCDQSVDTGIQECISGAEDGVYVRLRMALEINQLEGSLEADSFGKIPAVLTWGQATYGATINSTFLFRKILRIILQRSHWEKALLPANNFVAASSWPASYFSQASRRSRQASFCSGEKYGFHFLVGDSPGKTKTGFIRNFSSVRRSDSIRWVRASGKPPVAARRGSLVDGESSNSWR